MKYTLHTVLFICISAFSFFQLPAQTHKYDLKPCGTIQEKSAWLTEFQQRPDHLKSAGDDVLYIPLSIHLVGTDVGLGHFRVTRLFQAMCRLNEDFSGTNIQFFIEGEINFIDNSAFNEHDNVVQGANFMFQYNIDNTLNCYFMNDPAGNCGYNLPYAGVAMSESCSGPNDHTWAHEIGHALSLPHPFIGWEGGVSHDGSVSHSYSDPAPDTVLYNYTDFQSEFFPNDTLIIDTALVEYLDGSNCQVAADGFCDTQADYLNYRWPCDANNMSTVSQHDPENALFYSDGTLFMSYSFDECQNRFSEEQIEAMRANIVEEKSDLLLVGNPLPNVTEAINYIQPLEDETVQYNQANFSWDAVPNATHYFFQLSRLSDYSLIVFETNTTETSVDVVDAMNANQPYYWRALPYNKHSHCAPQGNTIEILAADMTNIPSIDGVKELNIYPNLIHSGDLIYLEVNSKQNLELEIGLYDIAGKLYTTAIKSIPQGKSQHNISGTDLPAGIYLIKVAHQTGQFAQRIMVH